MLLRIVYCLRRLHDALELQTVGYCATFCFSIHSQLFMFLFLIKMCFNDLKIFFQRFYRAMHFSAKRGIAIACRLSVRLSVCNVGGL